MAQIYWWEHRGIFEQLHSANVVVHHWGVCLQSLSILAVAQCRFIPRPLGSFTRDQEMEPLKEVRKLCRPRPLANYIGNVEIGLHVATARFDQEPWSLASTQYSPTVMKILGNEIFVVLAYRIAGNFCKLLAAVTKGCHAPTFCREAFVNSHKTSKFAKVISHQSFLL